MELILYILFFVVGILVHATYTYVLGTGTLILMVKGSIEDALLVIGTVYEKTIQVQETTYKYLSDCGVDEKEIEIQRKMDKIENDTVFDLIIGNLIHIIPERLKHLALFHNWKTAKKHITKIIKDRNNLTMLLK
tara:strand:- start:1590 stop:1991 length:402 start_codon:yes stop_codon:yes gene_type:complete